jgi:hypothetical protein
LERQGGKIGVQDVQAVKAVQIVEPQRPELSTPDEIDIPTLQSIMRDIVILAGTPPMAAQEKRIVSFALKSRSVGVSPIPTTAVFPRMLIRNSSPYLSRNI